jgi:hypothetical protein
VKGQAWLLAPGVCVRQSAPDVADLVMSSTLPAIILKIETPRISNKRNGRWALLGKRILVFLSCRTMTFSSTEKSPASTIFGLEIQLDVDFGAWQFSFRWIINGQIF